MSAADGDLIDGAARPAITVNNDMVAQQRLTDQVAVIARPQSLEVEAIASLRNYLLATHLRDGGRSLAICGATAGIGTSFIATNLAFALSQAGVNTLLIDGNLRDPALPDYVAPGGDARGLSEYLTAADGPPDFPLIRSDVVPNLSVLYAGAAAVQTQELIATQRFQELIDTCVRGFDMTIVDCPPSSTSGDARRIAGLLRYALVIARKDMSHHRDVRQLINELKSDRVSVIGSFLNVID